MRRLIVNADDLGADEARNDGIFEAIEAGVVTSASILANGPAFEDAVRRARAVLAAGRRVSFGVHVNLSEGRPLRPGLRVLCGEDGLFFGKREARRLLSREPHAAVALEALAEATAQVEAIAAAGIEVRHLDGHQHAHVYPAALDAIAEVAVRAKIPWVRVPEEGDPPAGVEVRAENRDEMLAHRPLARRARDALRARGLRSPDAFLGMAVKGDLAPATLARLVAALEEGTTELMVHPARLDGRAPATLRSAGTPFSAFVTPARERELEALLDPAFREALEAEKVELAPF